jgi:hypothetical protein
MVAIFFMPILAILIGFKYKGVEKLIESTIGISQGNGFVLIAALILVSYLAVTTGVTYAFYRNAKMEQK